MRNLERTERIASIELGRGKKVHILYTMHLEDALRGLKEDLTMDALAETNLYAFEWAYEEAVDPATLGDQLQGFKQNHAIYSIAEEYGVPMLVAEPPIRGIANLYKSRMASNLGLAALGYGAGSLSRKVAETTDGSRRAFLKLFGLGITGLAVTPLLSAPLSSQASYNGLIGFDTAKNASKVANCINPYADKYIVHLRNLLMARNLILTLNRSDKVNVATLVIGSNHVTIEDIFIQFANGEITLKDIEDEIRQILPEQADDMLKSPLHLFYSKDGSQDWSHTEFSSNK